LVQDAGSAIAQLAIAIQAHGPQATVALEKQAVTVSRGNLGHGLRAGGERLQHQHTQQTDLDPVSLRFHNSFLGDEDITTVARGV
jgi:hypothetical protein